MKLRDDHVQATGGCAECRREPVDRDPAPAGGPSVVILDETKPGWVGLELVDAKGRPQAGEAFELCLPDQRVVTGTLDRNGKV